MGANNERDRARYAKDLGSVLIYFDYMAVRQLVKYSLTWSCYSEDSMDLGRNMKQRTKGFLFCCLWRSQESYFFIYD